MTADLSADLPATACRGKVRTERGHGAGEAEAVGSHVVFSWADRKKELLKMRKLFTCTSIVERNILCFTSLST